MKTSSPAVLRQIRSHLGDYGLHYGVGALIVVASMLATHLYLDRSSRFSSGPDAAARAQANARSVAAVDDPSGIANLSAQEWSARMAAEIARQKAHVPTFEVSASGAGSSLNTQYFAAAPDVARQAAQMQAEVQKFSQELNRISEAAVAGAEASAPVQADMARAVDQFAGAASDKLRAARDRVMTSASMLPDGQYQCSFSAPSGAGLATVSAQGTSIDEACRAALAAPESAIVRLDKMPAEQR